MPGIGMHTLMKGRTDGKKPECQQKHEGDPCRNCFRSPAKPQAKTNPPHWSEKMNHTFLQNASRVLTPNYKMIDFSGCPDSDHFSSSSLLALAGTTDYDFPSGRISFSHPAFVAVMDIQYKIIGGDDAEYGPASLSELKSWIRDGRVAGMTKVWRSDLSKWSPADRYTELLEDLARLHATAAAAADSTLPATGFWARFVAFVIDHVLLVFMFGIVWSIYAAPRHWEIPQFPQTFTDAALQQYSQHLNAWMDKAAPIYYPIFLLYDVILNGRFGATIGKMIIRARIVRLDGAPIGYNRALLRWFAARISELLFFTGYFLIAFRSDKRALHDLLAGTKVVYKR